MSHTKDWSVIQALVAAGHSLPEDINLFVHTHRVCDTATLSVVRWLLQQGMVFDIEMLMKAAQLGRVDIVQLAHTNARVPITAAMIDAAARNNKWEVNMLRIALSDTFLLSISSVDFR